MKRFFQKLFDWEKWSYDVIYLPIDICWLYFAIKAGHFWYFTPVNPTLIFAGFEGGSKKEMYDQLPPSSFPRTIYILHDLSFDEVKEKIRENGFRYPFIVKPDVGMKGILFRRIDNDDQLRKYHERIPVEYIVQELIDLPVELSVFYYRHPAKKKGTISGLIQKELLEVYGDGKSTLWELILQHPRAKYRLEEMRHRHEHRLERVLRKDQHFYLSYAGNHNRGARFIDLHHLADEKLHKVFDDISHYTDKFYYGRYDVKCVTLDELKEGKNYSILEFNGCGAEPNHIYDAGLNLWQAYREILKHWKVLFEISKYNHEHGTPYWPYKKGRDFLTKARRHFKLLEDFD